MLNERPSPPDHHAPRGATHPCAIRSWWFLALLLVSGPLHAQPSDPLSVGAKTSYPQSSDAQTSDDPAIQAGREALAEQWDSPWYDAEADSLKAFPVKAPKPPPPPSKPWGFWEWLSRMFASWNLDLSELVVFLGWLALAALLVAVVWALVRSIQQADMAGAEAEAERSAIRRRIESVEALPAPVANGVSDLLAEAARRRDAGDLAGAIIYLFGHQLIGLDAAGAIRLVKGKTNRQYLRELGRSAPAAAPLLAITVDVFEASYFGGRPPTRERFDACWEAASLLPGAAAAAQGRAA